MNDTNALMTRYLAELGHSEREIKQTLARLQDYDKRAIRDSVFDSIAEGSFSVASNLDDAAAGSARQPLHDTAS